MKSAIFLMLLSCAPFTFAQTAPGLTNPCDSKRSDITAQLAQAKAAHNKDQIAGLEKALSEVNANCTPEVVAKDKQDKLNRLQQKVDQRMEQLKKAEASGKAKKIEKAKKRLQDSEQALKNAR